MAVGESLAHLLRYTLQNIPTARVQHLLELHQEKETLLKTVCTEPCIKIVAGTVYIWHPFHGMLREPSFIFDLTINEWRICHALMYLKIYRFMGACTPIGWRCAHLGSLIYDLVEDRISISECTLHKTTLA